MHTRRRLAATLEIDWEIEKWDAQTNFYAIHLETLTYLARFH